MRREESRATQLRTNIKASIAQLDNWDSCQAEFRRQRNAANVSSGGRRRRLIEARERAINSQGTHLVKDPPCSLCGSVVHLGEECDFIAVEGSNQVAFEDPSAGIHRGSVHRVCSLASELCRLLCPRFYPGFVADTLPLPEGLLLPVSFSPGIDYQELAIAQAVASLVKSISAQNYLTRSFLGQRAFVDVVGQPYHSASFPLDYTSFRDIIQERLSEKFSLEIES
jgi:hypothetical protein